MKRILLLAACALFSGISVAAADDPMSDIPSYSPKKLADVTFVPAGSENLERCPYIQMVSSTSAQIVWRSPNGYRGHVRMGRFPGLMEYEAREAYAETYDGRHVVRLRDLSPNTFYYYMFGGPDFLHGPGLCGDRTSFFRTAPPVGEYERHTRIWVLGDSGDVSVGQQEARDAYYGFVVLPATRGYLSAGGVDAKSQRQSRHVDLVAKRGHTSVILNLGDFAGPAKSDADFQASLFDPFDAVLRQSPIWPVPGHQEAAYAGYEGNFELPSRGESGGAPSGSERYYSFDYGNIHFIALDSTRKDLGTAGDPQLAWLQNDLAENQAAWTIVFAHHPPYSRGSEDTDLKTQTASKALRAAYLPVLENGGVDLVLSGHSRGYERSHFIRGHHGPASDSTAYSPERHRLNRRDGDILSYFGPYKKTHGPNSGTVYLVLGSSSKVEPLNSQGMNHPVMHESQWRIGSLHIEWPEPDQMTVMFLRDDRTVGDKFDLVKNFPAPKQVEIPKPVKIKKPEPAPEPKTETENKPRGARRRG